MKINGINIHNHRSNYTPLKINSMNNNLAPLKCDCVSFGQKTELKDWWEIESDHEFYLALKSFNDDNEKRIKWLEKKDWGDYSVLEIVGAQKMRCIYESLGDDKDFWFKELYRGVNDDGGTLLIAVADVSKTSVILESFGYDNKRRLEYIEKENFLGNTALTYADAKKAFLLLEAFEDDNERRLRFINHKDKYGEDTALFRANAETTKVILDSLGNDRELKIKAITAKNHFKQTPLFGADSKKAYYLFEVFGKGRLTNMEDKTKYLNIYDANNRTAEISDIFTSIEDSPFEIIDNCYSHEFYTDNNEAFSKYKAAKQERVNREFENETLESLARKVEFDEDSPKGFSDVVGMEGFKKELLYRIIEPIKNPEQAKIDFLEYGKKPCKTILLNGPQGCGKTHIIMAFAQEANLAMYKTGPEIIGSQYINASAKNVRKLFELLFEETKKINSPLILFIDEIDTMTKSRQQGKDTPEDNKQVSAFLNCMDEAKKYNIIIVGATNLYENLDKSIQSRFQIKKTILPPTDKAREEYLKRILSKTVKGQKTADNEKEIKKISKLLEGYSYRSINEIYQEAILKAIEKDRREISSKDFKKAIKRTREEKIDFKKNN